LLVIWFYFVKLLMGRASAVAQVAKPAPERNANGKRAGLATSATSGALKCDSHS
jgi:hypothetical protein